MNNKSIKEIIKARYSVRNYDSKTLSDEIINKINSYIKDLTNPFNREVKIKLIEKSTDHGEIKLGTYGVIKGAKYFFVSACRKDALDLIALGYSLEKVILYCTSLGLGTVWLGGTFNRSNFSKVINLQDDETIPIVAPVGYEGGKKSLLGSLIGNNKNKRKEFSKLFFNENFDTPLTEDAAKEYFEPLEMIRLAPSAINKQPWRVVKKDDRIDFYVAYGNLSNVDIGIALCHFHLTTIENNLSGEFKVITPEKDSKEFTYIMSWIKK